MHKYLKYITSLFRVMLFLLETELAPEKVFVYFIGYHDATTDRATPALPIKEVRPIFADDTSLC
jgi:hypothetical protein